MIYRSILPVLAVAVWLGGCGWMSQEDKTKDWSAQKFYTEAKTSLKEGDYDQAVKYYDQLVSRYPFGRYAVQAQLDVAYAHYKGDEPEAALAAADRFIKLYPQNPHVDYAYYLKGIVNYNRKLGLLDRFIPLDQSQRDPGSAADSFKDFSELVRRFPNSRYAKDARQRMLFLRNNLAKGEIHIARYYLHRQAYLAAANRAQHVVESYPRSTAVRDALEIMIEAYGKLGLKQLQKDAHRVLALNEAKGTFVSDQTTSGNTDVGTRIWNFMGLDKN